MDPATAAIFIKTLDIGFTLLTHYLNREESLSRRAEMLQQMTEISNVQAALAAGGLTEAEAGAMITELLDTTLAPMRQAMARL